MTSGHDPDTDPAGGLLPDDLVSANGGQGPQFPGPGGSDPSVPGPGLFEIKGIFGQSLGRIPGH